MKIDIELSGDDLAWLGGYIKGRTLRIEAGLDSQIHVDEILGRVLKATLKTLTKIETETESTEAWFRETMKKFKGDPKFQAEVIFLSNEWDAEWIGRNDYDGD